jgi:hypothetical protein
MESPYEINSIVKMNEVSGNRLKKPHHGAHGENREKIFFFSVLSVVSVVDIFFFAF